jgi:hypothetical protein
MEVDEPKGRPAEREAVYEMADEPREALTEVADEPRRTFGDSATAGVTAHERGPLPHDPDLPQPVQEEADEPRKLP